MIAFMPIRLWICIFISLRSGSQRCRKKIRRAKRVGVHRGQTSEHAREIACVIYLVFFTLFSDVTFFLLPRSEHGVRREFFICEDTAFVTPVCPRLVFGNAVPAHLVKYSLSGIGRFDKILPCFL